MKSPWQYKVTLTRNGQGLTVSSPIPYYVILSNVSTQKNDNPIVVFSPIVVLPKTSAPLDMKVGGVPVLTCVNNYGAWVPLFFTCNGSSCQVGEEQNHKG